MGWCQGGRKIAASGLDTLLARDTVSAGPNRRSKVLVNSGLVAITLPSAVFMLSLISLGQLAPPATAAAWAIGGDVVALPLLMAGGVQHSEAIRAFNRARGDTSATDGTGGTSVS